MCRCNVFDNHRHRLRKAEWRSTGASEGAYRRRAADCKNAECEIRGYPDEQLRPMADDEIAVDGYVMKPEVRGTSRDPRALKDEQRLVKVRMLDDGRRIQVHADRAQWEKLRENDRVKVKYRVGKYTGTVWYSEIE